MQGSRVASVFAAIVLLGCKSSVSEDGPGAHSDVAIGSEVQICEGCPVFVRVPDPPEGLRRIKYAAKFELTWNEYLASVDDGICPFPDDINPSTGLPFNRPIPDALRIDWPVVDLLIEEANCYVDWLEAKSGLDVEIPTGEEWRWLARGGGSSRYPWGEEPDASKAQVRDTPDFRMHDFSFGLSLPQVRGRDVVCGPGGRFPPNGYGLYDMIGLNAEVSSDEKDYYDRLVGLGFSPPEAARGRTWRSIHGGGCITPISQATIDDDKGFSLPTKGWLYPFAVRLILFQPIAEEI